MLPVNSLLYIGLKYGQEVPIKYSSLALSLVVVVAGVGFGLAVNWWGVGPHEKWKERLYTLGNISGLASIVLSLFASEAGQCAQSIFSRDLVFYLSIWAVSMTGLLAGCIVAQLAGLPPPQRCAVAVETTCKSSTSYHLPPILLLLFPRAIATQAPRCYSILALSIFPPAQIRISVSQQLRHSQCSNLRT